MQPQNDNTIPSSKRIVLRFFKYIIPILILIIGIVLAGYIKKNNRPTKKRTFENKPPMVHYEQIENNSHQIIIESIGVVMPEKEIVLKSQVSGEIIECHPEFTEGGLIRKGETIIRINSSDYQLTLIQKKRAVTDAEYELKIEEGRQAVAQREWSLLGNKTHIMNPLDAELALRKPHMMKAKAYVEAAKADLEKAKLDLQRTRIIAPFNLVIRTKMVDMGSYVTSQSSLADVICTDQYLIQISIPIDRLKWISIPDRKKSHGSSVTINYSSNVQCVGTVVRLLGDISEQGKMARVMVSVEDPLNLINQSNEKKTPLLIGDYVQTTIMAHTFEKIIAIPRTAIRDRSNIWLMDSNNKLDIFAIDPLWWGNDFVLIKNDDLISQKLIVSDLSIAVKGMAVMPETK